MRRLIAAYKGSALVPSVLSPKMGGALPEVSWLFFKAVRAGLAEKRPYLSHTGRASKRGKTANWPQPKGLR
jgi:hypothetical protein